MKNFKRFASMSLALALVFAFAACGSTAAPAGSTAAPAGSTAAPAAAGEAISVCIVTSSGVDDGSFGQGCYDGIVAYAETNPNAEVKTIKESDIGKVVDAAAQVIADYDVLVLPGFQFSALGSVAAQNPDTKIILVDAAPVDENGESIELPNVYSMSFKEQESGFFAGVAAALETKTGKVAVVNGLAFPSNVNYQFGFTAGVKYAVKNFGAKAECIELPSYAGVDALDGKTNVGGNYIGGFADQATGKVVGEALIKEGVDIMLVAAGDSGNGVFAAAKEATDVYVIGCDVDQFDDGVSGDKNIILTSALKIMDINVTKQLAKIADGTFVGKNDLLGADSASTGYVGADGRHQLKPETIAKLDEVLAKLEAGEIVPPGKFTEATVADFPGL